MKPRCIQKESYVYWIINRNITALKQKDPVIVFCFQAIDKIITS